MLLLSVPLHTMAARRASTALRTAMLANGCRLGGRVGAATMLRGGGEKLHGYGAMPNASARRSRIRARRLRTRIVTVARGGCKRPRDRVGAGRQQGDTRLE